MRKAFLVSIVLVPIMVIAAFLFGASIVNHKLELKTYFADAQGLRSGVPVRLAGVEVGSVTQVRARPDMTQTPAEVVMRISTPYVLKIPSDAVVSLVTGGILGQAYAEIDVGGTSGPPASNGDTLKSRATAEFSMKDAIERLSQALQRKNDELAQCAASARNAPNSSKRNSPKGRR